jgi:ribosomal-protein-alanine N-acetyltransferase
MDAPCRIRPATLADLDRLAELERVCFSDPWSREGIAEVLASPHGIAVVLELDDRVEAYVFGWVLAGSAEILNLAVAPGNRRRGLARQILTSALGQLRGRRAEEVYLEVRESNAPARGLYSAMGFRPTGMRRAYYRYPTEDAVVLRLPLPGTA